MSQTPALRIARSLAAMALTLLTLDLCWLGIAAKSLYDQGLASLRRPDVVVEAAVLFYAGYLGAIFVQAVRGAPSVAVAARRGAHDVTSAALMRPSSTAKQATT